MKANIVTFLLLIGCCRLCYSQNTVHAFEHWYDSELKSTLNKSPEMESLQSHEKLVPTQKQLISFCFDKYNEAGSQFKNNNIFKLSYTKDSLNLYCELRNNFFRQNNKYEVIQALHYNNISKTAINSDDCANINEMSLFLSHSIRKHKMGIHFNYCNTIFDNNSQSSKDIELFSEKVNDKLQISNEMNNLLKRYHLNIYANINLSRNLDLKMNFDYVNNNLNKQLSSYELGYLYSIVMNNNKVESSNIYQVLALSNSIDYRLNDKTSFVLKNDFGIANGIGENKNTKQIIYNSNFEHSENRSTTALNCYIKPNKSLSLNIGLRYAYLNIKTKQNGIVTNNSGSGKLIPSCTALLKINKFSAVLNYNYSMVRPSFYIMNNHQLYLDKYSKEKGSFSLAATKIDELNFDAKYKFASLKISYKYIKDFLLPVLISNKCESGYNITFYNHHPYYSQFETRITLSHRIKWWSGNIDIGFCKDDTKIDKLNHISYDMKPYWLLNTKNYFDIGNKLLFYVEGGFMTKGFYNGSEISSIKYLNLRLTKELKKINLSCSLFFNNILDTSYSINNIYSDRIFQRIINTTQRNNIGINIKYYFNTMPFFRYYGHKAASNELNRFKI